MAAATPCIAEGQAQYALHLIAVVDIRVVGGIASVEASLFAEVHSAGEFADAEKVRAGYEFFAKRAFGQQGPEGLHGAEIGI